MKKKLIIDQGSTFEAVVRWESADVTFKTVTAITKAAPPVLSVASHGVPEGWRVALTNILGMTELNAANDPAEKPPEAADYYTASVVTSGSISLDGVDATGFGTYVSGGILRYFEPVNLSGFTARMHIRSSLTATTTLLELTTENSRIALDNTAKTITLTISATDTALLTFTSAVYSLELVSGAGVISKVLFGTVSLIKEVTR